jgi:adenylate cyclase
MGGPQGTRVQRRLAAILVGDVVGFSALMGQDEEAALARVKQLRRDLIEPKIQEHGGRVFKTTGDGFLAEFPSPVEAVRCALEVQEALASAAAQEPSRTLQLRIGINLGDIIVEEDGDVYGDGVNVAARLEQLADPGSILISAAVNDHIEGKIEASFESRGEQQVKNIIRPVRVYALSRTRVAAIPFALKGLPLPDRPSIAVLPFTNMSGDPEQDYFAEGMVEEITAALARIRTLFVIARASTVTYKGTTKDVRQIAHELGVRYIVEGGIRRSGQRMRVTAQLVNGSDGSHLWAGRFDGEITDIFDLQDQLTEAIVGAIQPSIRSSEIERARRKRPDSLDAYECVMKALPAVWSGDPTDVGQALDHLDQAMAIDPRYPLAKSLASWCLAQRVMYMRSTHPAQDRERALALAEEAMHLDSDDPLVLTTLSAAYTLVRKLDRAAMLLDRALRLDSNSAWAWQRSGWLHVYEGRPEVAIEHFERGLRISPFDPINFNTHFGIGAAHFAASRYQDAVSWIEKALQERPSAVWTHRLLASAYAWAGRLEDARRSAAHLLRTYPDFTITTHVQNVIVSNPEYMLRYVEGLRIAGLPG